MPTLGRIMSQAAEAQSMTDPVAVPRLEGSGLPPEVRLVTDPADGHPLEVFIDWVPEAIDDEACYVIHDYDVIDSAPGGGLTRDEAIEIARAAVPEAAEWDVMFAISGPIGTTIGAPDLEETRWVWHVSLTDGLGMQGQIAWVYIDHRTGEVLEVTGLRP
jgi:hypothetical protein